MPSNVTRIMKELDNPDITVSTIADFIGLDQALAALLLQMSNSSSLGYGHNCTSLNEAVMRIGMKRLRSVLMASTAMNSYNQKLNGYRLGAGELWQHSLATAMACEWLAKALSYPDPEEAYVSGLLHDIGKLLLDQFVLTDYTRMVDFIQQYNIPLWQVEEKLIGVDHAKVGGLIAERWGFPPILIDAIRFHHYPSFARGLPKLPAIVNLGNSIVGTKIQSRSALFSCEIHPSTFEILSLNPERVERLGEGLKKSISGRP